MNYYMLDMPLVSYSTLNIRRIQVDYVPFNKMSVCPVSKYEDMEFEVTSYSQKPGSKNTLYDFYSVGEIPVSWGVNHPGVRLESSTKFLSLIHEISRLEINDVLKHNEPNLKRALCWPFSYPTLQFFSLIRLKDELGPWSYKGIVMTQIMRASKCTQIDRCVVNFHKRIQREALELGDDIGCYPGRNLVLEACSVICLRLLQSYRYDLEYDAPHSKLMKLVQDFDESFELVSDADLRMEVARDEFDTIMKRREAEETFWGSDMTDSD
ncbi:NSs [Cacao virus]|uniref:NSs n=1 Tax=Cacao virus TaxID=629730 RepID=A0A4P8D7S5_9VIRU|nr:NSs [Cacao virus]QCI62734.1 NSs [Cacao virus]QLA46862.1 NSs [Cacao virus]